VPSIRAVPATNRLLAALPGKDRDRLLAQCEPVGLILAEDLHRAGDVIRHVYFPTDSVISLVMPIDGSANLEVGLIGNEGMLGISLMLDVEVAPCHAGLHRLPQRYRHTAALRPYGFCRLVRGLPGRPLVYL